MARTAQQHGRGAGNGTGTRSGGGRDGGGGAGGREGGVGDAPLAGEALLRAEPASGNRPPGELWKRVAPGLATRAVPSDDTREGNRR